MGAWFLFSKMYMESFEQRRPCSDLNGQEESCSYADSRLKRGGDRGGKAKPRQGKMVAWTGGGSGGGEVLDMFFRVEMTGLALDWREA